MNYEYDIDQKDRLINVLEAENTAMKLAIEEKDEKIDDLDKWVSVLTEMQSTPSSEKVIEAVNNSIATIEKMRLEKFYLKKEIAYEHKRYNDLKSAFIELRREAKDKEMDYKDRSKQQLVEEKLSLQSTIVSLSDEIESLSVKNEEFLSHLSKQDFYHEYQNVKEELQTLKNAHTILINMIKDDDLQIQTKINTKDSKLGESDDLIKDTSFIWGTDLSKMSNDKSHMHHRHAPLQEIDLNQGRNNLSSIFSWNAFGGMMNNGKYMEQEVYLKEDKTIKNNVEFFSHRLENVDINFLKHKK